MPKKKDSTALFEVISKAREEQGKAGMGVPAWMGKTNQPATARSKAAKPAEAPIGPETIVSTVGGRLRLSLNYVSCSVAVLALVLLLIAAFWLGRATASGSRVSGPGNQAAMGSPTPAARDGEAVEQAPARTAGLLYPVIQDLQGASEAHKQEAYKIRDFLAGHDLEADVWKYQGGQYIVWSLKGFDDPDSPEARDYLSNIEALGQRYKARGNRYDFRQHDIAGKPAALFLPAKTP